MSSTPLPEEETIAAQATPAGTGGIAIVRLSGAQSKPILCRLFQPLSAEFTDFEPWKLHHGRILGNDGEPLDDVLAVFMPGPRTFTGEDCAEIHCHGGQTIVRALLEACFLAGARPAQRGEFSRRAFEHGRMDLSQAEAVAEMIASPSREALRYSFKRLEGVLAGCVSRLREQLEALRVQMSLSVDFPDDEVEIMPRDTLRGVVAKADETLSGLLAGFSRAQLSESGAEVVLAGSVNAGKSSLLNALLGRNRALVTDIPGTTRDFIEASLVLDGLPVRLVDTAGLRETADPLESMGIARSREKLRNADCIVYVVDGAVLGESGLQAKVCPEPELRELLESDQTVPLFLVWNKSDLYRPSFFPPAWCTRKGKAVPALALSARTGEHLDEFADSICRLLTAGHPLPADDLAPNLRQARSLGLAKEEIDGLLRDIDAGQMYDLLSVRLDLACMHLADVIGLGTPRDVLDNVFAGFCIGK